MKKLLSRLLLLALLAALLQLVLVPRLRKMKDVRRFEACFAAEPEVVVFCDSTNAWIDEADEDRRAITEMLSDLLGGAKVGHVTRAAYHSEVYAEFVDLIARRGLGPDALVVPINLRSFSPEWDRKPAYQFAVEKRQIRHADDALAQAVDPLLRTLHLTDDTPVTQSDYKATPVFRGEFLEGFVRDFDNPSFREPTPERTRRKMIFHYMYPLREDHRKLEALRRISRTAREHDLRVVFYFSPVDVETGESLLPGEFRERVAANVATIREALSDHEPALIDLSDALGPRSFSWHDYPNEHLCEVGRRRIAAALAEVLEPGAAARPVEASSALESGR